MVDNITSPSQFSARKRGPLDLQPVTRAEWYREIEDQNIAIAQALTELKLQLREIGALKAEVSQLKVQLELLRNKQDAR